MAEKYTLLKEITQLKEILIDAFDKVDINNIDFERVASLMHGNGVRPPKRKLYGETCCYDYDGCKNCPFVKLEDLFCDNINSPNETLFERCERKKVELGWLYEPLMEQLNKMYDENGQ